MSTAHMGSTGGCPLCGWHNGHHRMCRNRPPHRPPRRESGPWQAFSSTAGGDTKCTDEYHYLCRKWACTSKGSFKLATLCRALDAVRGEP